VGEKGRVPFSPLLQTLDDLTDAAAITDTIHTRRPLSYHAAERGVYKPFNLTFVPKPELGNEADEAEALSIP